MARPASETKLRQIAHVPTLPVPAGGGALLSRPPPPACSLHDSVGQHDPLADEHVGIPFDHATAVGRLRRYQRVVCLEHFGLHQLHVRIVGIALVPALHSDTLCICSRCGMRNCATPDCVAVCASAMSSVFAGQSMDSHNCGSHYVDSNNQANDVCLHSCNATPMQRDPRRLQTQFKATRVQKAHAVGSKA